MKLALFSLFAPLTLSTDIEPTRSDSLQIFPSAKVLEKTIKPHAEKDGCKISLQKIQTARIGFTSTTFLLVVTDFDRLTRRRRYSQ